ncbi:MAG: glycosyltransferase family 1 protein [Candidatus Saccharibacteria bacterium]
MKIAIDLSVLQSYHRLRGIGAVAINFINHLPDTAKKENKFIFFINKNDEDLAFKPLNLSGIDFEIRYFKKIDYIQLPGMLRLISKIFYKAKGCIEYITGDPRISKKQLKDVDRYIQFDQIQKLPKQARKKAILIIYDIIPYALKYDYLSPYRIARSNGLGRKAAFRSAFLRRQYKIRTTLNCKRARTLIAISENTKKDFVKYFNINEKKIKIALLGVDLKKGKDKDKAKKPDLNEYKTTMWGSVLNKIDLGEKPFILFAGGIDPRRKITELLAAYNNLRARGIDISLVLSGDSMDGLENLKNDKMKKYLTDSNSYNEDIHLMGYVSNEELNWLYGNALAFVFPSIYEGFGLPVLEAMGHGCPVVTFDNTSIREAGGKDAIYVKDFIEITDSIQDLMDNPAKRARLLKSGVTRSQKFTWEKTAECILKALE